MDNTIKIIDNTNSITKNTVQEPHIRHPGRLNTINTVVCSVNHNESGQLNEKESIKIFWIKYTQGGMHKPLNILQRDWVYGLSVKPSASGT